MADTTFATGAGLRVGVALWQELTLERLGELAKQAEDDGYDYAWYANHKLYRDLFVGLSVMAMHTETIGIGSFIAEPYSQHPAQIAAAIATIDELSGGRAALGLGAGGGSLVTIGIQRRRPVGFMSEATEIAQRLLAGERFDYEGEHFQLRNAGLEFPVTSRVPVVLAARGDRMLEAAGRVADAVMVAPFATAAGLGHARTLIERGIAAAGRSPADIPLVARVDVALDDDVEAAMDAVRPMIAMMVMASWPSTTFLERVGLAITPELSEMSALKDEHLALASGHLVPDEYVRSFAWVGKPDDVAEGVAGAIAAGYRNVAIVLQPLHRDPGEAMSRFAHEVMPRVVRLTDGVGAR